MRSGRWWPATDGAGVHIDGWEQGGVRGGFRSMQFPRRGTGGDLLPCPRGNCVALTPAGVGWLRTAQPPDVCRLVKFI